MTPYIEPNDWKAYCARELVLIKPLLAQLGFALEDTQIHIGGERSVISGNKLVLLGHRIIDQKKVVIKASSHPEGRREISHAHTCRMLLNEIQFAHNIFLSPEELVWHEERNIVVSISAFIEQECSFLERPFKEQFFLALKTFELQESAHATTYEHRRMIRNTFGIWDTSSYLHAFHRQMEETHVSLPSEKRVRETLVQAEMALKAGETYIAQYLGFLTHTDFVPHNVRIVERDVYLLDHSAIRFGNKYDGWARFLNFMLLYHRELERSLVTYIKENRTPEESETLHLMRIFRLGELIWYYARRLQKTTGLLHELDKARVLFWTDVLETFLQKTELPDARIRTYQILRDSLRSEEEKRRQQGLH